MKRLRSFALYLVRLVVAVVVVSAVLVGIAALYAWRTGNALHPAVTSTLFIGAAVLVIWNGFRGGGVQARRADLLGWGERGSVLATPMAFDWVFIGLAVGGLGVLSAIS